MKIFKKLLIGLAGILAILVIVGLTQPSLITIERSLEIDAPVEMVFDQVNNLHNWEKWSPWHKIDTAMGLTYQNGGIGKDAGYTWTSNHKSVGNGSLTITDAKEYEYINTLMDFGEQGTGTADFKFVSTDNGVTLSWDMKSDIGKNPFMRLMGIVMRKSISSAYDRGLSDIANQCEYLKETGWYHVKIKTKPAEKYYGISSETAIGEINVKMEESFKKLYRDLETKNIAIKGTPFAIYHTWGDTSKFECCVPVDDNTMPLKGIDSKALPEAKYAVIKYIGSYDGLMTAHEYMAKWLSISNKELVGPVIEKYKTDPELEEDASKWVTYVLYPIN